jgi:putative ABC transport system substrate-binding protein
MLGIRRRDFISVIGGAVAWPIAAHAQQPAMPVVGFLSSASLEGLSPYLATFRQGLGETGFVEGRNVAIESRWSDNDNQLQRMAAELVRAPADVIVAPSLAAALAAKSATTTIPIVFYTGLNPVNLGLVASFNRPGGNVTGIISLGIDLASKRVEVLHDLIPTARTIAVLVNPATSALAESSIRNVQASARTLGLAVHVLNASTEQELDEAFASVVRLRAEGLVIGADNFFNSRSKELAALALRHAIPAIYQYREFAAAGGLMSYGGSLTDGYRMIGIYGGRILKGEKAAELPVQQATKIELIINLKTAKALGITVPLTLRGRADEVIE